MSFSAEEVFNSVLSALTFGVLFSAVWTPLSFFFKSAFISSLGIIFYGFGFMLLSYYCLDGMLRGYMLAFSFFAFYLSKKYVFEKLLLVMKKMVKKVAKIPLFGKLKRSHTLDKS